MLKRRLARQVRILPVEVDLQPVAELPAQAQENAVTGAAQ